MVEALAEPDAGAIPHSGSETDGRLHYTALFRSETQQVPVLDPVLRSYYGEQVRLFGLFGRVVVVPENFTCIECG